MIMKGLSSTTVFFVLAAVCFASASEKIDINTAPLEDLVEIVHIGESRAKELIFLRPFSSIDDLAKIKGIGPSRINDIKKQGLAWVSAETLKTELDKNLTEAEPQTKDPESNKSTLLNIHGLHNIRDDPV